MEESRFDGWTRRRFGLSAGGLAASLAGMVVPADAAARRKNKKRDKIRCRQALERCDPNGAAERCCSGLNCDLFGIQPGLRCCLGLQTRCDAASNRCCRSLDCTAVDGLDGDRCCASIGEDCTAKEDCCGDAICGQGSCLIQM